jgi:hypothetical protein
MLRPKGSCLRDRAGWRVLSVMALARVRPEIRWIRVGEKPSC